MTDEELRSIVASNAQAIERSAQAIEHLEQKLERTVDLAENTREEIELIALQVRSLSDSEAIQNDRLMKLERKMIGVYDILRTNAREQAERSRLIDQQIQALIDERRRA